MKLLLTSSGISNQSIHNALVDLLGKPIAACNALFIPTAIYPFPRGAYKAWNAINGTAKSPLLQLGWKALGLLELTALPGIDKSAWIQSVEETDVLLVWGGDPAYLAYWLKESGLADYLHGLQRDLVYVGVSAGSMATATTFVEAFRNPPNGSISTLTSENSTFDIPNEEISWTIVTAQGAGFVDFAVITHYENSDFPDASEINVEKWAVKLTVPAYAIDDQSAIKVANGKIEVVSEGRWKLFNV